MSSSARSLLAFVVMTACATRRPPAPISLPSPSVPPAVAAPDAPIPPDSVELVGSSLDAWQLVNHTPVTIEPPEGSSFIVAFERLGFDGHWFPRHVSYCGNHAGDHEPFAPGASRPVGHPYLLSDNTFAAGTWRAVVDYRDPRHPAFPSRAEATFDVVGLTPSQGDATIDVADVHALFRLVDQWTADVLPRTLQRVADRSAREVSVALARSFGANVDRFTRPDLLRIRQVLIRTVAQETDADARALYLRAIRDCNGALRAGPSAFHSLPDSDIDNAEVNGNALDGCEPVREALATMMGLAVEPERMSFVPRVCERRASTASTR